MKFDIIYTFCFGRVEGNFYVNSHFMEKKDEPHYEVISDLQDEIAQSLKERKSEESN